MSGFYIKNRLVLVLSIILAFNFSIYSMATGINSEHGVFKNHYLATTITLPFFSFTFGNSTPSATTTPAPDEAALSQLSIQQQPDAVGIEVTNIDATKETISVPNSLIEASIEQKVSMKVKRPNASIELTTDVLKGIALEDNQKLDIKINNTNNETIVNSIKQTNIATEKIMGMIDLSMAVLDANNNLIKNIETFEKPILVTVNNIAGYKSKNKVAVFNVIPEYLANGTIKPTELKYVGGTTAKATASCSFYTDHLSYYVVCERNPTFLDINNSWARNAIEILAARNIIKGIAPNQFGMGSNVRRVDFSVLMNKSLGKRPESYKAIFSDLKASDYYSGSILSLNKYHILDISNEENSALIPFGVFVSNTNVFREMTREQAATYVVNAYQYTKSYDNRLEDLKYITTNFKDISLASNDIMRKNIKAVSELGVMVGYDGMFRPKDVLTREQASQILYNLLVAIKVLSNDFVDIT